MALGIYFAIIMGMNIVMNLMIILGFIGFAGAASAESKKQWADQRVNRHMVEMETKLYHQQKLTDIQNENLRMQNNMEKLSIKDKESNVDSLSLPEKSYSVGGQSPDLYVDSPLDELSQRALEIQKEEELKERLRQQYYEYVRSSLEESGVEYEIQYEGEAEFSSQSPDYE